MRCCGAGDCGHAGKQAFTEGRSVNRRNHRVDEQRVRTLTSNPSIHRARAAMYPITDTQSEIPHAISNHITL